MSPSRHNAAPARAGHGLEGGVAIKVIVTSKKAAPLPQLSWCQLDSAARCDYKNYMSAVSRKTVGSRELKTRLGSYLRAVRSGTTILVTERGEPVAEIRPLPRGAGGIDAGLDSLAALGILTRGSGEKLDSFVPMRIRGRAVSDAIRTDREDRF